jgi:hypothetical protein
MTVMAAEAAGERAAAGSASARARAAREARKRARQYGSQAAYVGRAGRVAPGDRGYQPVILAEFLAAVVIVAVTPVATGGSPAAKAKGSLSPYDTGDLRQLVAVGGVYFVLALASGGNSGRLSAWLGGLVLIGLGMVKASRGNLAALFSPGGQDQGGGQDQAQ